MQSTPIVLPMLHKSGYRVLIVDVRICVLVPAYSGVLCGPVICGVLRKFSVYSRCSWLGECVVATVCCVVCVIEYGWYVGRGDCGVCG